MWIKGGNDAWFNLAIASQLSVYENTVTDWHVLIGSGTGQLVRTFTSQAAAELFIVDVLSEQGLSSL